jgi:two-component system phosphate regulon sensor histidine kinase PhoR
MAAELVEIERLTGLAREIAAVLDVDQMLAKVVEIAINLAEADEGAILLAEARGGALITRAAKNAEDTFVQICCTPAEDRLAMEALRTGQAARFDAALQAAGGAYPLVHTLLYVPLRSRAHVLGVLRVDNRQPDRPLTPEHQRRLQALADYAAIAIENALLYTSTEVERAQFETILSEMVDGVVVVDFNGRVVLMNSPARAALKVETPHPAGQLLNELVENAEVRAFLRGENQRGEIKLEDGRVFNAHATCIASVGCVLVMQDITPLKELDRIKSDFVNAVSHDLRSPLTAILGYVELIGRVGPVNEQQADFIRRIQFGVHSITALITDLLDLGRIEAGFDEQKEPTHLATVIKFAVEDAQSQADAKQLTIQTQVAPDVPNVLANPPRLRQMLSNLINNAIKYTPAGGGVHVAARVENGTIVLTVSDSGVGIPAVDLPYVFNKFYRAANIRDTHQGTGLGLSIVKSIVENHGGRIWVDSKPGEGTTFTVILPRHQEVADTPPTAKS